MKALILAFISFAYGFCSAQQVVITNTNVADVENQKMLANVDVLIRDGKIMAVGKSLRYKAVPTIINGTGKYLIPGLVDAHVHFFQSGGIYTRPDVIDLRKYVSFTKEIEWTHRNMEDLLRRYVANGITTVIDVGSTINFLKQRDTFQNKWYAPAVYMTGPLLTTYEPTVYVGLGDDEPFYKMNTVEEARKYVQQQLPYKPDFIKIWYIVLGGNLDSSAQSNLPLVQAVIDEAHKNNLRVAVHATQQVTARLAVEAGTDFLVHNVDDEVVNDSFTQLLKQKGTVLCPTMVVSHNYSKVFTMQYPVSAQEWRMANPIPLGSIQDVSYLPDSALMMRLKQNASIFMSRAKTRDSILAINLKKLLDAGVIIATGTDAGNIGTQHVSAYFDELAEMQKTGATLWQLLQASTINGAKAVGKEKEFGSITVGKTADVVLLNANPLESLNNWNNINAIINKGNLLNKDSIVLITPELLAQQQLNAYNAHHLDAFLEPYADSVEIYRFPNQLLIKGKEQMRKQYAFVNNNANLHCNLLNRIVQGNTVIDQEEVFGFAEKPVHGIVIYKITNGKIDEVYFIQ